MSYTIKDQTVYYTENGKKLAESTFPLVEGRENLININSTFVDDSLRGKGVGNELMKLIVNEARENGWLILPTCPFSTSWFKKHTEYHDLLRSSLGK